MTVANEKLLVEHTLVNSKRISKILRCSSLTLLLRPGIGNQKYAISGNMEIGKIWKESGCNIYCYDRHLMQYMYFYKKILYKK